MTIISASVSRALLATIHAERLRCAAGPHTTRCLREMQWNVIDRFDDDLEGASDEQKYHRLEAHWHFEITSHSSFDKIVGGWYAGRIIGMGERVLPFLIEDLRGGLGAWPSIMMLRVIIGDGPQISEEHAGRFHHTREQWIAWLDARYPKKSGRMTQRQREHALSEVGYLRGELEGMDPRYILERSSFESRLEKVLAQLAADDEVIARESMQK